MRKGKRKYVTTNFNINRKIVRERQVKVTHQQTEDELSFLAIWVALT